MNVFVVAALALFAVVLLLLCRPFMGKRTSLGVSHAHVNALAYQEHRRRLDMDLAEGSLSPHDHAQAQRELAQRVLDESHGDPSAAQDSYPTPTRTLVAVGLWLPVTAVCLYLWLGTPEAIEGPAATNSAAAQEVEQMVAGLVQKLKLDPNNPKGWAMLARSYKVMGRPLDAEKAYARAAQVMPLDAQMLADYADVAATNANGNFAGKPADLIQQALAADPNHPMALWLAGTAAFRAERYTEAIQTWTRFQALLPPDSDDAQTLVDAIQEARDSGGTWTAPVAALAAKPAVKIEGVVELGRGLQGKVLPTDVLMVIARRPGERMPLAVFRSKVADFPHAFVIDDSLRMGEGASLSAYPKIELEARVSKSGQAKPEPGDLYSATTPTVTSAKSKLNLRLDAVRP